MSSSPVLALAAAVVLASCSLGMRPVDDRESCQIGSSRRPLRPLDQEPYIRPYGPEIRAGDAREWTPGQGRARVPPRHANVPLTHVPAATWSLPTFPRSSALCRQIGTLLSPFVSGCVRLGQAAALVLALAAVVPAALLTAGIPFAVPVLMHYDRLSWQAVLALSSSYLPITLVAVCCWMVLRSMIGTASYSRKDVVDYTGRTLGAMLLVAPLVFLGWSLAWSDGDHKPVWAALLGTFLALIFMTLGESVRVALKP